MGLSVALGNALSGMRAGQSSLEVLSRNVANAGVPGYHRQSVSVIDSLGVNATSARVGVVTRAFDQSIQSYYTNSLSESGFTSVRAGVLDRLQAVIGKPGSPGSLDTVFGAFQGALSSLAVSPEDYAVRGDVAAKAQALAETLNHLSLQVQTLRRESETQMQAGVDQLNAVLGTLETVNSRLSDQGLDPAARASLADQRDRLVGDVAKIIDVRVDYRGDGTVALMTRSGVGILDGQASAFEFESAGLINASSQFNVDSSKSSVGRLIIRTPAGLQLDAGQQNVVLSGELGALLDLRDRTLVQAQDQLDQIAAGLARSLSTVQTEGTPDSLAGADGLRVDTASIRNGNDLLLSYRESGLDRSIRFVRVDDTTKLPMDVRDAEGNRVVGIDFSGGAGSVAAQIQTALGSSFAVDNPAGTEIRILDDGAGNTINITGLTARSTVAADQDAGLGLSLFVDNDNTDYTDHLDGDGQRLGFAARVRVNRDVLDNLALLVQSTSGAPLTDASRATYLVDQLSDMRFATFEPSGRAPVARLSGSVNELISQSLHQQGNVVAQALAQNETQGQVMQALTQRLDGEYGVDVDEEMGRLMELQNAYAANARVLGAIQELLQQLIQI